MCFYIHSLYTFNTNIQLCKSSHLQNFFFIFKNLKPPKCSGPYPALASPRRLQLPCWKQRRTKVIHRGRPLEAEARSNPKSLVAVSCCLWSCSKKCIFGFKKKNGQNGPGKRWLIKWIGKMGLLLIDGRKNKWIDNWGDFTLLIRAPYKLTGFPGPTL